MSTPEDDRSIVELNVGGIMYTTTSKTLKSDETSLLRNASVNFLVDGNNRVFIDRDGTLFRFVLDYLRTRTLVLPENFAERRRLRAEADYYKLPALVKLIDASGGGGGDRDLDAASLMSSTTMLPRAGSPPSSATPTMNPNVVVSPTPQLKTKKQTGGCIIVGYRGTFANGRDGLADVKFRKISRILVCGRVQLMREVFGDTLNESRDPDHGVSDRYTSRFFLKHTFLEQAFDTLLESNFMLVCAAATGTNPTIVSDHRGGGGGADNKTLTGDNEENKWLHYNEFIFVRNFL